MDAATVTTPEFEQVRVRVLPDGRMTRADAARYLGYESKTLAMWAMEGKGPRCVRVGWRAFYFKDDLDRFIAGGTGDETQSKPGQVEQPPAAA